jgi:hypothetical protein
MGKNKQLEEFTLFPKLPVELRTTIWKESSSEPRLVEVHVSDFNFKGKESFTFASTTPVPTILHVNQESRLTGLKQYSLHFGSDDDVIYGGLPTVYFDMKKDVVLFRKEDRSGTLGGPISNLSFLPRLVGKKQANKTLGSLSRVAVFGTPNYAYIEHTVNTLVYLPKLSEVFLVTKEYHRLAPMEKNQGHPDGGSSVFYGNRLHLEDSVRNVARWVAQQIEGKFRKYSDNHPEKNRPKPVVTLKLLINVVKRRMMDEQA